MEAANTFAVAGELMDFALTRRREGHPIPTSLICRDIITEKCQLINTILAFYLRPCLLTSSITITNNRASIQFHDIHYTDSEMHCVTLSNVPDLEEPTCISMDRVNRDQFLTYFHLEDPVSRIRQYKYIL